MNKKNIVDAGRNYLVDLGYSAIETSIYDDEYILMSVNMLFFGGIQAFARRVIDKERKDGVQPRLFSQT